MKRLFLPALLFSLFLPGVRSARADMPETADMFLSRYVSNSVAIAIVRAQTADEAALFPPPKGKQRVYVEEILKGVETRQEFLVPEKKLQPGKPGVALFQPVEGSISMFNDPGIMISVYPMDEKNIVYQYGLPSDDGYLGLYGKDTIVPLESIKKTIVPEEVGLNAQVVDALLFPEKFKALAAQDPKRATYVRFVVAVRDLERNVPLLAPLLESKDKAVRVAAEARLVAFTGAQVPGPKDESPASLHDWSTAWAAQVPAIKPPEWPPVPANMDNPPPAAFPEPLLKAIRDNDADAFAKEFAAWLDSGVMRDRQIELVAKYSAEYIPKVPSLTLVLKPDVSAGDRMKEITGMAVYLHHYRIIKELAAREDAIGAKGADVDLVRRAAFWEPPSTFSHVQRFYLKKLAVIPDNFAQEFLKTLCFSTPDAYSYDAAWASIQAGYTTFTNPAMLHYAEIHDDDKAVFLTYLLCRDQQPAALPIALGRLKSENTQMREWAAEALCWIPRENAVPALLRAIAVERAAEDRAKGDKIGEHHDARRQMLVALAQTGDKRGLETLLAAAREPFEPYYMDEIARGLARIRDKKALPALARAAISMEPALKGKAAGEDRWEYQNKQALLSDAVEGFNYVSNQPGAREPDVYEGDRALLGDDELKQGLLRIYQWQKENAK